MTKAYDIVIRPIISEKATLGLSDKVFTFEVDKKAQKPSIKRAIETVFNVEVESINTVLVKGKPKRQGRNIGYTKTWKKAIVKLKPDSNGIEFFEGI